MKSNEEVEAMLSAKRATSVLICLTLSFVARGSLAIDPVGTSGNNQDYVDLANNTDDFLSVGLVSVNAEAADLMA